MARRSQQAWEQSNYPGKAFTMVSNLQAQMYTNANEIRPSVFVAACQAFGIAKVAPLYFVVTLLTSDNPIYQRTSGRIVDPAIAKAALPALIIGFIVPSTLMFIPSSAGVWQIKIALWQLAPIIVGPLASSLASMIRGREGPQEPDPHQLKMFGNRDLMWLLASYTVVFIATGAVHAWTLSRIISSPSLTLSGVFWHNVLSTFFKWNLAIYATTLALWCQYSVLQMRQMGYITTSKAWSTAIMTMASTILFGPAATYAGIWFWKERTIAGLSK